MRPGLHMGHMGQQDLMKSEYQKRCSGVGWVIEVAKITGAQKTHSWLTAAWAACSLNASDNVQAEALALLEAMRAVFMLLRLGFIATDLTGKVSASHHDFWSCAAPA